jgi:hypothetical protein
MIVWQQPAKGLTAPVDIGFSLAKRDTERVGDLLIAHLFEVKQDERYALMIGQLTKRSLQVSAPIGLFQVQHR